MNGTDPALARPDTIASHPATSAVPDHVHAPPHATNRIVAAIFAGIIGLPLILTLAVGLPARSDAAAREDGWPGTPRSLNDVTRWPMRFRRWFRDHYVLRRELIGAQGTLVIRAFDTAPSPVVLLGRDDWWFYRDDGALEDIISATPMPPDALSTWQTTLEHNQGWLARRGIPYLFVLAPDKHLIYPEFLPDGLRALHQPRIADLVDHLAAHSQVNVLDLREPLLRAKAFDRLYHRTDTHWNNRGALVAFLAISQWMGRVRPGTSVPTRNDFELFASESEGRDLPSMIGLEHLFSEQVLDVRPRQPRRAHMIEPPGGDNFEVPRAVTEHPDKTLPRILFFRDSFMSPLAPFFAEYCRRCVFVWQPDLDPAIVERERPDIVIHEWVGRRLHTSAPYDAIGTQR